MKFDNKKIISSNEALNLKELPASINYRRGDRLRTANLFSELGSQVTIAEKKTGFYRQRIMRYLLN